MTPAQFDSALRGFCRRQPFQPFWIEFTSGNQMLVTHPEAVGPKSGLYIVRRKDSSYVVFASESVARLLDDSKGPAIE
jgi:hypothetical protein